MIRPGSGAAAVVLAASASVASADVGVYFDAGEVDFAASHEFPLSRAAPNRHRIERRHDQDLVIEVGSADTSIRCSLLDANGKVFASVDSPGHREFPEILMLRGGSAPTAILEIALAGSGVPAGTYQIRLHRVDDHTLSAWSRMFEAGRAYASGEEAGKERATRLYRAAAGDWAALGDRSRQAMADYLGGVAHFELGRKEAAIDRLTRAHDAARLSNPGAAAVARVYLGYVRFVMGETDAALGLLESALDDFESQGKAYQAAFAQNNLALIHHYSGSLTEAERLYRQAAARMESLGEVTEAATILQNLGGIHYMRGESDQARAIFEESLRIKRQIDDLRGQADVLGNLARLIEMTGNYGAFLERQLEILEIRERLEDRAGIARARHSLGVGYAQTGDFDKALAFLEQAREQRAELSEILDLATTYRAIGEVRALRGEHETALEALSLALPLESQAGHPIRIAQLELAIAQVRLDRAKTGATPPAAGRGIVEAAAAAVAAFTAEDAPRSLAEALLTLGDARRFAGLDGARGELEQAIEIAGRIKAPEIEVQARLLLAMIDYDRGELDLALAGVERAIEQVAGNRATIHNATLRATYLATKRNLQELRTDLLVEKHLRSGRQDHALTALVAHQEARAVSLRELARASPSDEAPSSGFDPSARELRDRLNHLTYLLRRAIDDNKAAEVAELERRQTQVLAELDRAERHAIGSRYAPLDLESVRSRLDEATVVLVYALGERRSFVWVVTQAGLQLHRLPARSGIAALVGAVHDFYSTPRFGQVEAPEQQRADLTRLLLPGVERLGAVDRLLFVPDGVLFYLPFAALMAPSLEPRSMLVENYEIGIVPSLSFIAEEPPRPLRQRSKVLLVGQPKNDSQPLPHAAAEISAIAELYPAEETTILLGPAATRAEVMRSAPEASLLHFATHGFVDDRFPQSSGLALASSTGSGATETSLLLLPEIMALDLTADSVVLSACEGARGALVNGEGLIGLTYGFLAAGAANVVSSLWRVSDRHTPRFMQNYYRRLAAGDPALAALRAAQLEFLASPQTRSPYYWAGFAHFGGGRHLYQ